MGYIDDVNTLVPTCDVKAFFTLFKKYGEPLGVVVNIEKTCIMTLTTGKSAISRLRNSWPTIEWVVGESFNRVVESFSQTKKVTGSACRL